MSEGGISLNLSDLLNALANGITALISGIANAINSNADAIGEIIVFGGLIGLLSATFYGLYRRGIFGRLVRGFLSFF